MAVILLILLCIIEIGFAIFELTNTSSRREWTVKRTIACAGELVLFFAMALLQGIDTGFRFKGLMLMLILRLIAAGIFAGIRRRDTRSKRKAMAVLGAIGGILLITLSSIPAFLFTDYEGLKPTGPYNVLQAQAILIDESRIESNEEDGSYREVPVYFFYPEGVTDKMPLVIFSHGAFGYYPSNASTYLELASNGYVVVSIEHPYHSIYTHDTDGKTIIADRDFINETMTTGSSDGSEAEVFELTVKWMEVRLADMNFAIDSLKAGDIDSWYVEKDQRANVEAAVSLMDTTKIGLIGHSMGGATAVTAGRREDISAVVDLDGTMLGENIGVDGDEILVNEEPYPTPILDLMNQEHFEEATEAARLGVPYSNNVIDENAIVSYRTYFAGSAHMDFTDLPMFSPALAGMLGTGDVDNEEMLTTMNGIVLGFFDCYLKGEGNFSVNECY